MGADDHAQGGDANLAHVGVGLLHVVPDVFRVGQAVGVEDQHVAPGGIHLAQIVQHRVQNGLEGGFPAAHLFGHVQRALIGDIEHGLDVQHGAHQRPGVGYAAAALEVVQIVHGEAVGDLQLVLLAPADHGIEVGAGLHLGHHVHDQQAQATGDAAGVHHAQALIGVFAPDTLGRAAAVFKGDGHLLGHIQENHVLAGVQQLLEEIVIDKLVDHRGLEDIALAHAGVDGGAALLPAVVLGGLLIDGEAVGDEGNMMLLQIGPRQIGGGGCGNDI